MSRSLCLVILLWLFSHSLFWAKIKKRKRNKKPLSTIRKLNNHISAKCSSYTLIFFTFFLHCCRINKINKSFWNNYAFCEQIHLNGWNWCCFHAMKQKELLYVLKRACSNYDVGLHPISQLNELKNTHLNRIQLEKWSCQTIW